MNNNADKTGDSLVDSELQNPNNLTWYQTSMKFNNNELTFLPDDGINGAKDSIIVFQFYFNPNNNLTYVELRINDGSELLLNDTSECFKSGWIIDIYCGFRITTMINTK